MLAPLLSSRTFKISSLLVLKALLFFPLSLFSQNRPVASAAVPFSFVLGNHEMPAGSYVLSRVSNNMYSLRQLDGKASRSITTYVASRDGRLDDGKLIFRRRGNRIILTNLWLAGSREGVQFPGGKAEQEFAADTTDSAAPALVAISTGAPQR